MDTLDFLLKPFFLGYNREKSKTGFLKLRSPSNITEGNWNGDWGGGVFLCSIELIINKLNVCTVIKPTTGLLLNTSVSTAR